MPIHTTIFSKIISKIISLFYYSKTLVVVVGSLDKLTFEQRNLKSTADSIILTQSDLDEVKQKFGQRKYDKFKEWLNKAVCVAARDESGIIGYTWYTDQFMPREGTRPFFYDVSPPPGAVYLFDGYILPDKRNYFTTIKSLVKSLEHAKQHGYKKAFTTTNNEAVRLIYKRLRFKEIGRISYKRFLFFSRRNTHALSLIAGEM